MSNTWSVQFLDDEDDLNEANGGFFFLKEAWQQAKSKPIAKPNAITSVSASK